MKIKRRNKANPEFSLAAMVDVILLLLIFFMITSSAANVSAIEVKLPETATDQANVPNPVAVTIKPDGTFFLDDQQVAKEQLETMIVSTLKSRNSTSFTIRADENTLHKDVVYVMEIAEKHKLNIALATTKSAQ